jgi:hypothetical protein
MIKLIKVYSAIDESIFLSLLDSANIEAISDATNFNRIQFGTLFTEDTGITISVNEDDILEAKEIASSFIDNKKMDSQSTYALLPKLL